MGIGILIWIKSEQRRLSPTTTAMPAGPSQRSRQPHQPAEWTCQHHQPEALNLGAADKAPTACLCGRTGGRGGRRGRRRGKKWSGALTVPCLQHVHSSLAAFAPLIPPFPSQSPKPTPPKRNVTQFGLTQTLNESHLY